MPAMHQAKYHLKPGLTQKLFLQYYISESVVVQNELQVRRRSPWRASIKHDVSLLSRWWWQRYNQALLTSAATSKPLDLHSNEQPITPPSPSQTPLAPDSCTRLRCTQKTCNTQRYRVILILYFRNQHTALWSTVNSKLVLSIRLQMCSFNLKSND